MRYTLINLRTFDFSVLDQITNDQISDCKAGLVSIIDMRKHKQLAANGKWVNMEA